MLRNNGKYLLLSSQILAIFLLVIVNFKLDSLEIARKDLESQEGMTEEDFVAFLPRGWGDQEVPESRLAGVVKAAKPQESVLSVSDEVEPLPSVPLPSTQPSKKGYLIAAVGDSMVQTMGDSLEYLGKAMREKYPDIDFVFYNYGLGAQNVTQGLEGFDKKLVQPNKDYAPLSELKPDIIIVGSFAYNPFPDHDRDQHWLELAGLVDKAKESADQVYILAEIAPLEDGFGVGFGGVNWSEEITDVHTAHIIELLENAVGLSEPLGVGLINVFSESQIPDSKYGKREYIDGHDGIHPSALGHQFTADTIASTISLP